jgi:hypothetical protein
VVGEGRRSGLAPLRLQGSRLASRQGDRIGRQARRDGAERRASTGCVYRRASAMR